MVLELNSALQLESLVMSVIPSQEHLSEHVNNHDNGRARTQHASVSVLVVEVCKFIEIRFERNNGIGLLQKITLKTKSGYHEKCCTSLHSSYFPSIAKNLLFFCY